MGLYGFRSRGPYKGAIGSTLNSKDPGRYTWRVPGPKSGYHFTTLGSICVLEVKGVLECGLE